MADHAELIDDLTYYARAGSLDELKELNPEPTYLVEKDGTDKTALHVASANGHLDIVNYIIEKLSTLEEEKRKELINIKNEEGNTPLHWAALNDHIEVVEALVKNGADCKIKNDMGHSPIYEAQQKNQEKIAEFFLKTMIEEESEGIAEDEQYVETGTTPLDNKKSDAEDDN